MVVYGWTGVFWDMDDFPLPDGLGLDQFVKNVKLALWNQGFRVDLEFLAFGSSDSYDNSLYLECESFSLDEVVGKRIRFYHMLNCMQNWLFRRSQFGGLKSVLFIAKGIPGEDNNNMVSFFENILWRGYRVFTVVPEGCSRENFDYPDPILAWHWPSLCSGDRSIVLYPTDDDDSGSSSPETDDRAQGVKRASETDAAGTAKKLRQKEAGSQN